MVELYVASSQSPSKGKGGWGFVLVAEEGQPKKGQGSEDGVTHNQMILKAAIEGLSKTDQDCEIRLCSNSEYLVIGIKDSRQRKQNRDLWEKLDDLANRRHIEAEQIGRHKWLSEAQMLAKEAIGG